VLDILWRATWAAAGHVKGQSEPPDGDQTGKKNFANVDGLGSRQHVHLCMVEIYFHVGLCFTRRTITYIYIAPTPLYLQLTKLDRTTWLPSQSSQHIHTPAPY
jgi:hypothetical protein